VPRRAGGGGGGRGVWGEEPQGLPWPGPGARPPRRIRPEDPDPGAR
jgi:hypothetical protein